VEIEGVAGCVVTFQEDAEWTGYNDHLTEFISWRHGGRVLDSLWRLANSYAPRTRILNRDSVMNLLRYPGQARRNQVHGSVFIEALLNPEGTLSQHKVVRGLGSDCDAEALRLASLLRFQPFPKRENAKATYILIPIKFDSAKPDRAP
jgi:TonB family protein